MAILNEILEVEGFDLLVCMERRTLDVLADIERRKQCKNTEGFGEENVPMQPYLGGMNNKWAHQSNSLKAEGQGTCFLSVF
jgi:hypothetical protein